VRRSHLSWCPASAAPPPSPPRARTALALKDAVEALRQHRAEREQIELVLRARVISDAALEVVTKALGEEVITAAGAVDAEGMGEAVKAKAQTELATAKEHVKLHEKQKTAIAAARAASGRALGNRGRWVQGDSASQNQLRLIGSLMFGLAWGQKDGTGRILEDIKERISTTSDVSKRLLAREMLAAANAAPTYCSSEHLDAGTVVLSGDAQGNWTREEVTDASSGTR
jgi:hypothetical protein